MFRVCELFTSPRYCYTANSTPRPVYLTNAWHWNWAASICRSRWPHSTRPTGKIRKNAGNFSTSPRNSSDFSVGRIKVRKPLHPNQETFTPWQLSPIRYCSGVLRLAHQKPMPPSFFLTAINQTVWNVLQILKTELHLVLTTVLLGLFSRHSIHSPFYSFAILLLSWEIEKLSAKWAPVPQKRHYDSIIQCKTVILSN